MNALLKITAAQKQLINREPFELSHGLADHPLFTIERLRQLSENLDSNDYFISRPATQKISPFYHDQPDQRQYTPTDVLSSLPDTRLKILFKRPENNDHEYRALLDNVLDVIYQITGTDPKDVVRAESGIFVTGSHAITPYHFDPEITFFFQITGKKTYHLYSPMAVTNIDRERHYSIGQVSIGHIKLTSHANDYENVFQLGPGLGVHQPSESPHWVETHEGTSVSYAVGIETKATRARGRVYAFNHFERKLGINPAPYGKYGSRDRLAALTMIAAQPVIQTLRKARDRFAG